MTALAMVAVFVAGIVAAVVVSGLVLAFVASRVFDDGSEG